jgi:hypothetical protein
MRIRTSYKPAISFQSVAAEAARFRVNGRQWPAELRTVPDWPEESACSTRPHALGDLSADSTGTILVLEEDEVAVGRRTRPRDANRAAA